LKELLDFPAVELFVQRAAAIDPGFKLTRENYKEVAMICARLEGLPLAIELAAARIKFFSPQALLARLGSNLTILAGEVLALPARQQTLRGAIEWSYDLLTGGEKKLFCRLAVFAGGRAIEAVDAVCNAGGDVGMDVTEGLISLTDKSLLHQEAGVGGEPRFVMLQMIHDYALEKLRQSGEEQTIRRLHALYFATLAEQADLKLYGASESRSLDHLEEEHDNLRSAIQWSHLAEGDVEIELRLVAALGAFWDTRGHLTEGRERIAAALARPESRQDRLRSLRGWALIALDGLAYWQGDFVTSRSSAEEALYLFREIGEMQGTTRALTDLWSTATAEGDHESSVAFVTEALRTSRELGDEKRTALLLVLLGWSQMYLGKYAQAAAQLEEALLLVRKQEQPTRTALALAALGEVMVRQGKYDEGVALLEEALAIRRDTGYRSRIAAILGVLALAAIRQEKYGPAVQRLSESLKIREEIGDKGGVAWCLERFAQITAANGDAGDVTRAARLLGAAGALREAIGTAINTIDQPEYDQTVNITQRRLGEGAFTRAWLDGSAMGVEEIVEYALQEHGAGSEDSAV
jgi:tetratricopeptide (TPR) repeat protein